MDRRSWLLLVVLGATWGASYMFIKIGIRDLSPAQVAWGRTALAAAVLLPVAASQGALRGLGASWAVVAVIGAVQVAAPFSLIALGEQEVPSALAGILIATAPLFTAVLAVWVDHEERAHGVRLLGLMLGFLGVIALLGLDLSDTGAALLGGLAILLASLGYAVGGLILKRRLSGAPPLGIAAAVMLAAAIMLAPLALVTAPSEAPGAGPIAAVAALGILGTGIAFVIFYGLIARIGPARALIVSYLAPGFAVVYGSALLDEPITVATVLGLGLILAGSWLAIEGRLPGARAEPSEPPQIDAAAGGMAPAEAAPREAR